MSYALCPCLCVSVYLCPCPCVPGSDLGDFPDQQSRLCPVHGHEDDVDGDDDNDDHYHAGLNRLMIREQFLLTTV